MQKNATNILVVDIGSGSVGLALIKTGSKNSVTFATRYELEYSNKVDFNTLLEKMLLGIEQGIKQLPKITINSVKIYMHSPWHTIQTKKISIKEKVKFKLTEKLVQNLSKKEIDLFNEQNKINFPGYTELVLIESAIPEIKINGYVVPEPFNKKVFNCDFSLSLAFSPKNIVESVKKVCLKFLPVSSNSLEFHSATLAFTHICSNLYDQNNGIMIIDVGSEITDILLVKNKTLSFGVSFAEGTHDIVRKVAETLETSFSDAVTKIHTKFSEISSQNVSSKIDAALMPIEKSWQQSVSKSLSKLPKMELVPKTVILICEEIGATSWYQNSIKSDTLIQYLKTDGSFQIITPNVDALKNNIDIDPNLKYIDISLGLLCIAT